MRRLARVKKKSSLSGYNDWVRKHVSPKLESQLKSLLLPGTPPVTLDVSQLAPAGKLTITFETTLGKSTTEVTCPQMVGKLIDAGVKALAGVDPPQILKAAEKLRSAKR